MKTLILLLSILALCEAGLFQDWKRKAALWALGFNQGDECGFSRKDALVCLQKHVDTDHDGHITLEELDRAREMFLPRRARAAAFVAKNLFHAPTDDESIMRACDADGNGTLEEKDWWDSEKKCLPHEADLCLLKELCVRAEAYLHPRLSF